MRAHVLAFHAPYKCRHAGVCCSSGWDIPVEAPLYRTLHAAVEWGQLRVEGFGLSGAMFEAASGLPHGEPALLGRRANRHCVFFEPSRGNLCAIQRQMGHAHLPSACRHFPRVVLIDPRGVFITLSNVCPTAASLLLEPGSAHVVLNAPGFDDHAIWEGLDAREELPPLIRPDLLWDWQAWDRWERRAVRLLADTEGTPEQALQLLRCAVTAMMAWRPAEGPLVDAVDRAFEEARAGEAWTPSRDTLLELERCVTSSTGPASSDRGPAPAAAEVPGWEAWSGAVRRFLASRAFANWVGCYGTSLATWFKSIEAAYAVLRLSAARASVASGTPLDRDGLIAALADTDHLLMHQISAEELARGLEQWEERR